MLGATKTRLVAAHLGLHLLMCHSNWAINVDTLVARANIYYRATGTEEPIDVRLAQVDDSVLSKDSFKLIIHGFTGSRSHSSIRPLVHAYMAKGGTNVLLADWEDVGSLDYPTARVAVAKLSRHFAKLLLAFINEHGIDRGALHLIGHSLGAHIAGGIGSAFNGTLARVTGLDPALPLFTPHSPDALHPNAAQFVDVIHTDYPVFGDLTPRGTADFYPNFGFTPQRGCEDVDLLSASKLVFQAYSCSHNRAVTLFAESIGMPENFPAIACNLNAIRMRNASFCSSKLSDQDNEHSIIVYMGENVSTSATGIFFLATFDMTPFGMGLESRT